MGTWSLRPALHCFVFSYLPTMTLTLLVLVAVVWAALATAYARGRVRGERDARRIIGEELARIGEGQGYHSL